MKPPDAGRRPDHRGADHQKLIQTLIHEGSPEGTSQPRQLGVLDDVAFEMPSGDETVRVVRVVADLRTSVRGQGWARYYPRRAA